MKGKFGSLSQIRRTRVPSGGHGCALEEYVISRIANKFKALIASGKPQPTHLCVDSTSVAWLEAAPGVKAAANDHGLTILDTVGGRVFVGSDAAALIWLSASKGLSLGETAGVIAARFGGERNLAERRVRLFLELLEQNGLALRKATNR
jgi:hypothetical protein